MLAKGALSLPETAAHERMRKIFPSGTYESWLILLDEIRRLKYALFSMSSTFNFLRTSSMAQEAEPGFTRSHLEEVVDLLLHLLRNILGLSGAWACSRCLHAHGTPGADHSPRAQGCKPSERPCRQLRVHGYWRHLLPRLSRVFTGMIWRDMGSKERTAAAVLRSAQDLPNPSWQSHAPAWQCSGFTFKAGITRENPGTLNKAHHQISET